MSEHQASHSKTATLADEAQGRHLPVPFIPTTRRVTKEDRDRVVEYTPFNELPPGLYPELSNTFKAPVMHCGWTMGRLWKYTEENGFGNPPPVDWREYLPEEDLCDDDPIDVGYVDQVQCMDDALVHLVGKLGVKEILTTAEIEIVIANRDNGGFLSLYTNYSYKRAPSSEAIEKLRVALGEEEGPKWYLDGRDWYWKPKPASAIRTKPKRKHKKCIRALASRNTLLKARCA